MSSASNSGENAARTFRAPGAPLPAASQVRPSLGIPATAAWLDHQDRPHHIYEAEPIAGLM
ncbi:MAG: hypothetical protein ACKVP0_11450 [Pirellulaceae bacterium]